MKPQIKLCSIFLTSNIIFYQEAMDLMYATWTRCPEQTVKIKILMGNQAGLRLIRVLLYQLEKQLNIHLYMLWSIFLSNGLISPERPKNW